MKKKIISIICFLALLAVTLWKVNDILSFKFADGNSIMRDFYKLDRNTVDVLFVGSSHCYVNFNNGELWEDYGIASYDLAASDQPIWNSYFYIKEALKTQSPELIVLEGYGLTYDFEYSDDSRIIKNTYGLKWSVNKIQAMLESIPKERRKEFMMEYGRYHTRYSSLNQGDFYTDSEYLDSTNYWHYKSTMGQYLMNSINPNTFHDVSNVTEKVDLQEKTEKYYRKILELAKEKGIPIVVVVNPYSISEVEQGKFIAAESIAQEYGVEFYNCNLFIEETGIDRMDYHDLVHMTEKGSRKYSKYIGNYLKTNYEISDRRGDGKYKDWELTAEYTAEYTLNTDLVYCNSVADLPELLLTPNHVTFISQDGRYNEDNSEILNFYKSLGIDNTTEDTMWIFSGDDLTWKSSDLKLEKNQEGKLEGRKYVQFKFADFCMKHVASEDGIIQNGIIVDKWECYHAENGLNVVVYDKLTGTIVESLIVNFDDGNSISR